jgi:DNA-binding Lrp family transcriptional regulator
LEYALSGGLVLLAAFVLINTEVGSELDVLRELKKIEGVEEAVALYGAYDILLRVASKSMEELKRIITWDIRKMSRVRSTLTMIINEGKVVLDDQSMLYTML